MTIYTYYSNVPDLEREHELKLMLLWRERWTAAGFEPFTLTEWHATKHPMYAEWSEFVKTLPSVNPEGYERACWMRWLALAGMGGGYISDYDVMPYDKAFAVLEDAEFDSKSLTMLICQKEPDHGPCPSLVLAYPAVLEHFFKSVMKDKPGLQDMDGRPHYSDMYAFECFVGQEVPWIRCHDFVKLYGEGTWQTAPFVHYSNSTMQPAGKTPRYLHIPNLRQ